MCFCQSKKGAYVCLCFAKFYEFSCQTLFSTFFLLCAGRLRSMKNHNFALVNFLDSLNRTSSMGLNQYIDPCHVQLFTVLIYYSWFLSKWIILIMTHICHIWFFELYTFKKFLSSLLQNQIQKYYSVSQVMSGREESDAQEHVIFRRWPIFLALLCS